MRSVTLVLSVLALPGCYSIGNRDIIDSEVTAKIISGETAKDRVSEILGEPTWVCFEDGDQVEWHYCYTITTLSFRQLIPVFGLFAGPDTVVHTLTLRFDENGVVRAAANGEARSKDCLQGAGQKRAKKRATRRYDGSGRALPAGNDDVNDRLRYEG